MSTRRLVPALLAFALVALTATGAAAQCQAPYLIEWPVSNPVWKLCWTPPDQSAGPDGSGLQITHAFYRGRRVLWRLNMPVLNVLYDPSTSFCGPTYRDWLNQLQPFDANNVVQPGYAEPTVPPRTVCDAPGADVGSFAGVAVEKLRDRVVLTSQTTAGWYRYINKTTFHADGTIEPMFGFTAVEHPCIHQAHTHHGYWRMDLDVEGAANDSIRERKKFLFFTWWSTLRSEQTRLRNSSNSRRWRVRDNGTGRAVEIQPGVHDRPGGDPFGGPDVWALLYRGTETDDGGATGGAMGDAQHITPFVNGEAISARDVVLWYRVGHRHERGASCTMVGPRLRLIGNW
jgi:hypothetical protein